PIGDGSLQDRDDTITCRRTHLSMAHDLTGTDRMSKCTIAGPSGGGSTDCGKNSGGQCGKFCNAWSNICGCNRNACINACPTTRDIVTCRFPWLLLAASDPRYCPLLDLSAPACIVPGC